MTTPVELVINGRDNTGGMFSSVNGGLNALKVSLAAAGAAAMAGFGVITKQAIDATAEYEKLTLTMETLAARELIKNSAVTTSTTSTRAATQAEKDRAAWLEKTINLESQELNKMEAGSDAYIKQNQKIQSLNNQLRYLGISQTGLVNTTTSSTETTMGMAQALGLAAPRAQELLRWTQALAIKSPFDQASVADSLKQAMAYGFTSDEAMTLTQNLVDMSAGMGLSSDKMGLVSYALGQINQSGKLMTQDLRQLMSAGVPVIDILGKMGYSLADVGKTAVDSKEFLALFNKTMKEDFGGSAERMTKSWSGMLSTFQDIKKIGLRTLFADTFEALQPLVGALEDWLLGPGLGKIEEWGKSMGDFTKGIIDFASDSSNFDLSSLTGKFKDFMRDVDWQKVSDDITTGIKNVDWVGIGQEIRTSAANIWKGLSEAAKEIDWLEIGGALKDGLAGVVAGLYGYSGWDALAADFQRGIDYSFGNGIKLDGIWGVIMDPFYKAVGTSKEEFSRIFSDTVSSWKLSIANKLNEIKGTFTEKINGWKQTITTKIEEIKRYMTSTSILDGFIRSITTAFDRVKTVVTTKLQNLKSMFLTAPTDWMANLAKGITDAASRVYTAIQQIVDRIKSMFNINISIPGLPSFGVGGSSASGLGSASASASTSINVPKPKNNNNVQANALGGPIRAGQTSWVGEVGKELFVAPTDGYIIPSNAIAGLGESRVYNNYYNAHITITSGIQNQARDMRGLT